MKEDRIIRPVNGTGYTAGKSPRDYLIERMERAGKDAERRAIAAGVSVAELYVREARA